MLIYYLLHSVLFTRKIQYLFQKIPFYALFIDSLDSLLEISGI